MPVVFIEAPPGIRADAKKRMVEKITSAIAEAYHIGDTLVFLREYTPDNVALDGRLQSENPKVLDALKKIGGDFGRQDQPMQSAQLHEDKFLQILWDDQTRIIRIDWKEATSVMTDEDFKSELTLFAQLVEDKRAPGILIDVTRFRHRPGPEAGEWRLKNISTRYNAAGVKRFAFLVSKDVPVSAMPSEPPEGEQFLTRSFNSREQAVAWLTASG